MNKILLLLSLLVVACGDVSVPDPDLGEIASPESVVMAPDTVAVEDSVPVVVVEPIPAPEDFCRRGEPCDTAGDRILARMVNPSTSTFQLFGPLRHLKPGDIQAFVVCAKDTDRAPVAGLPAVVWTKPAPTLGQPSRQFAGDGTTLTKEDGCVKVSGVVSQEDMFPGDGSKLVYAVVGGRVLNTVLVLPDSQ